jgi:hypothetical protein
MEETPEEKRSLIRPKHRLKYWEDMLHEGRLEEVVLEEGSFLESKKIREVYNPRLEYVKNKKKKKKKTCRYYNGDFPTKIERDTLFRYAPGRYAKGSEVAGIYLKNVITPDIRGRAFTALEDLDWIPPKTRAETIPAIKRQKKQKVQAKEIHAGHTHHLTLEQSTILKKQPEQFAKLEELLTKLDEIYRVVLPEFWHAQNTPKTLEERFEELARATKERRHPNFGGIAWRFRLFLTAFSSVTLLKSCPAAVHQDSNGSSKLPNFSVLTSIGKGFTGGTFCLLEYGVKIPVQPGDVLICQSTREWHCNIKPVDGLKYSIVAYYKPPLVAVKYDDDTHLPRLSFGPGPTMPKELSGMKWLDAIMSGPYAYNKKTMALVREFAKLIKKVRPRKHI